LALDVLVNGKRVAGVPGVQGVGWNARKRVLTLIPLYYCITAALNAALLLAGVQMVGWNARTRVLTLGEARARNEHTLIGIGEHEQVLQLQLRNDAIAAGLVVELEQLCNRATFPSVEWRSDASAVGCHALGGGGGAGLQSPVYLNQSPVCHVCAHVMAISDGNAGAVAAPTPNFLILVHDT
jgi:hypothetical protein